AVTSRDSGAWLADYFGLPRDFQSTLLFEPEISNFFVDLDFYVGLDEWCDGLYFEIHAPITRTKWNLNFCETNITKGSTAHPEGYFGPIAVETSSLLSSATSYFSGQAPTIPDGSTVPLSIGSITFQPLKYSKFASKDCNDLTETRLGDIEMALGYNLCCDEDYHIALSLRASAPTGNDRCPDYLFSPLVGSGKHWKFGGGISAHALLWTSEDEGCSFGIWMDANIQHLFEADQKRTFDLAGKPNSRYMLAEKLGTTRRTNQLDGDSNAGVEWQNEYAPVANLTTSCVTVDANVEGNVAIKFAYMGDCMQIDAGYAFYGRSCEKIDCRSNTALDGKTWALKGDAYVVGFASFDETVTAIRLAATESSATICSGTNGGLTTNLSIDNPTEATATNGSAEEISVNTTTSGDTQTRSSNPPIYLSSSDIGYNDNQTRLLSHTIFVHASYEWTACNDWTPFIGVGASYEFDGNDDACDTSCSSSSSCSGGSCSTSSSSNSACTISSSCCHDAAVNQWSVWFKGGIAF
ncbi:MAG: hypothetical protein WBQ73_01740, partial [Candidatus Babeliales bacterium]